MTQSLVLRNRQPEIMDQPGLDAYSHIGALRSLERLNVLSRSDAILWTPIRTLAQEVYPRRLEILDIASGGGDLIRALDRRFRRAGFQAHFQGCDISACAVDYAQSRADEQGMRNVSFVHADAFDPIDWGRYDVVCCSLFLHHLEESQAIELLSRMAASTRHLMLVNDLCRGWLGYLAARIVPRLFVSSPIVRIDGPLSAQAAFSMEEVRLLADQAGLYKADISGRWPFRFLLTWRAAGHPETPLYRASDLKFQNQADELATQIATGSRIQR